MKIGFDAKRAYFNRSGLGNYSRNIILALNRFYPENQYFLFTPPSDGKLFSEGKSQSISPQGFYANFPSLWRYRGLGKTAQKYDLDIFHGLSNELPRDVKCTKAKSIVSIHDAIFMRFPKWYKWHDRWFYEQKTAFACKHSDVIVAVSQQTKEDLMRFFKVKESKIKVIYQPCNPLFEQEITEEQKQKVSEKLQLPDNFGLMVGNIEERKNHLNVIKAIHNQKIDIPLVIVGRNSDYALNLKKYIAENNIQNIHFQHNTSQEDLPAVYSLAKILIYPSFFEGFGIPIAEALWCGTPVITSNVSCFEETAGDAALFIDPYSEKDIALAISTIMENETERTAMIEKGKAYVNKFSAKAVSAEMMKLYSELC
jgi:glycosyltransferase involved in cell wall biosynthesis